MADMKETGTTIWLNRITRDRIEQSKDHPRDTSDDVVNRALDALEVAREARKDSRQDSRAS